MAKQRKIPALTLIIVGISFLAFCNSSISALLVYDREAVLAGHWWRMMTSPLVHFSASHLFWDALVFGVAGWAIETAPYRGFWLVIGLSTCIPGFLLLLMLPQFEIFGGLSGLATGAVAYLCLCKAGQTERGGGGWIVLFVLIGVKILFEAVMDAPLFVQANLAPFRVIPGVHIAGYLSALAAWTEATRKTWLDPQKPATQRLPRPG